MAIDLDNYEFNLYLDGVLEGTKSFPVTSSGIDSDYPLLIGKIVDGQNFDGSVDDLRIYNRALSGSEVTALYESEVSDTFDSDGDGVGDDTDAFPNDPNETTDTDNDGVGDNSDEFPTISTQDVVNAIKSLSLIHI